ncbi:MAG TPA: hypothetical protein VFV02_07295, partial [Acidimicrobiales bacterium]|nr:hypothetical protein [Acidimicrobiales bacterium]
MRIARWGAAAGAVVLVSLPIAAQAEVLPSPQIDTSSVLSNVSTVRSGITSSVLHRTVTNLKSNLSHAAPSSSGVHSVGLNTNKGLAGSKLTGGKLTSNLSRHSAVRSSHVRTNSARTASVTRASSVHAADTQTVVVPAPTSTAAAYAANILNAIAISHTIASAGNNTTQGT